VVAKVLSLADGRSVGVHRPRRTMRVYGDPVQIASAMSNLVCNALLYGLPQEPPCVVELRHETLGSRVRVAVCDRGSGMTAEQSAKAFQMFERFHPEVPGTGLGLATVRRVMERHGGHAWIDSEPDRGTAVWMEWPGGSADAFGKANTL
ncbi:MAG: HAMP domain-containing sensor histidine kinase, partial [Planctomycetota bacterium]